MKRARSLLVLCSLLAASSGWGTPSPQQALAVMGKTEVVNAKAYGVACDGVTDDYAAFNLALADVPTGGRLYIPPSGTACLLSQDLVITKSLTVFANPGTVILKAKTGNISNPVLINVNGATGPVLVYGVTFDGGGSGFANTNNVVQAFNSTLVTFDHIVVQNTRGIGLLISSSSQSGVRDSQFVNIGMNWQTSLSGTDRYQGVAFCCTTTMQPKQNFVIGNFFAKIGLDAISLTNNNNYTVVGNRCDLGLTTAQFVTLAGQSQYPACVYVSNNTGGVISGNVSDSAPGNAYDIGTTGGHSNLTITGNYATTSGGAGIAISATNDFAIAGNVLINNGQNAADCHIGAISFANTNTIGTVVGNEATDTQGSPTQQYGVYSFTGCANVATLTNVWVDQNNQLVGNKTAAYGGGLSVATNAAANPSASIGLAAVNGTATTYMRSDASPALSQAISPTMTGNWSFSPSSGTAINITAASGQFGMLITPASGTDAFQILGATGQIAQIKLRGNGVNGASAMQIGQDGSSVAHVANNGNAAVNIDVNGTTGVVSANPDKTYGGVAVAIASLPTCNSGEAGRHLHVNNGVASPTYQGAVSTTGTTTQSVYCNGTGWVYD